MDWWTLGALVLYIVFNELRLWRFGKSVGYSLRWLQVRDARRR